MVKINKRFKLAKIRKRDVIALILFIIFFWFIIDIGRNGLMALADNQTQNHVDAIIKYMNQNKGMLPSDLNDLHIPYRYDHYKFSMIQGLDIENIKLVNGKLFDKNTHEQIFILKGPISKLIKKQQLIFYEQASLKLYNEMVRLQADTNSPDPNSSVLILPNE